MRRGTEPSKGDAPCWQTDRSSSRAITNYPIGVALERLHSWSLRTSAASAQCQPRTSSSPQFGTDLGPLKYSLNWVFRFTQP